jgi:hypothetical protein
VPAPLAFVAQPEVAQRCPDKWSVSRFRQKTTPRTELLLNKRGGRRALRRRRLRSV